MTDPQYHVASLAGHGQVAGDELQRVFQTAWRQISVVRLEPGDQLGPRTLNDSEVMLYVISGAGTAQLLDGPVELRPGIAVTLFMSEQLHLMAGDDSLEIFFTEIGEAHDR